MKTIKKILFFLLFPAIFLISCNQKEYVYHPNDPNNPLDISPTEQILKMHPVKITFTRWADIRSEFRNLKTETEQEFLKSFGSPENWVIEFETTDMNQINIIMASLKRPHLEKMVDCPDGIWNINRIYFEDKKGRVKRSAFVPMPDLVEVCFPDRVYSKETYKVFAEILNIKYEPPPRNQQPKPSTPKPSE